MASTVADVQAVKRSLSAARMGTYEAAAGVPDGDPAALRLYAWNAQVSAAFLAPLHVCEVVIRNAVADALEAKYGNRWPWSPAFERSLPDPSLTYSPRRDLQSARRKFATTGKVIPELKFAFWQRMFTSRHDSRLWDAQLLTVLPHLQAGKPIADLRKDIYDDLEIIRALRNRIAHHEPIFQRNLADDMSRVTALVQSRCGITAAWMVGNQQATALIPAKP